jgi:hypothetical protein
MIQMSAVVVKDERFNALHQAIPLSIARVERTVPFCVKDVLSSKKPNALQYPQFLFQLSRIFYMNV